MFKRGKENFGVPMLWIYDGGKVVGKIIKEKNRFYTQYVATVGKREQSFSTQWQAKEWAGAMLENGLSKN